MEIRRCLEEYMYIGYMYDNFCYIFIFKFWYYELLSGKMIFYLKIY